MNESYYNRLDNCNRKETGIYQETETTEMIEKIRNMDLMIEDDERYEMEEHMGRSKNVRKRMIINIITTVFIIIILVLVAVNGILVAAGNKRKSDGADGMEQQSWQVDKTEREVEEQVNGHKYETDLSVVSNVKPKEKETKAETETEQDTQGETQAETQPEIQTQTESQTQLETQPPTEMQTEPQTEPQTETQPPNQTGTRNAMAFWDSSTRYIDKTELVGMNAQDLVIARNEIFARLGRGFKESSLQEYFDDQIWYTKKYTPEEFNAISDSLFTVYEIANINTIVAYEKEMGYR